MIHTQSSTRCSGMITARSPSLTLIHVLQRNIIRVTVRFTPAKPRSPSGLWEGPAQAEGVTLQASDSSAKHYAVRCRWKAIPHADTSH